MIQISHTRMTAMIVGRAHRYGSPHFLCRRLEVS